MRERLKNIVRIVNRNIFVGERYERNMRSMAYKDIIRNYSVRGDKAHKSQDLHKIELQVLA